MVRARSIAQILNADNKPEDVDILEEYSCRLVVQNILVFVRQSPLIDTSQEQPSPHQADN